MPRDVELDNEAKSALSRVPTLWIEYVARCSREYRKGADPISDEHVYQALEEIVDFPDWIKHLDKQTNAAVKRIPKQGGPKKRSSDDETAWGDLPDEPKEPKKKTKKPTSTTTTKSKEKISREASVSAASVEDSEDVDMSEAEIQRLDKELEDEEDF